VIPLHPEPTPAADELRWVTPPRVLPAAGRVAAAPGALGRLVDDGVLASVTVEPAAVVTRLGPGRSWPDEGAAVRSALHAALADPDGWTVEPAAEPRTDDARLRAAAEQVLAGPVGDYVRSHGGRVDLESVRDGVVEIRLRGACAHCPAAAITVHARLEAALRRHCPDLRELRRVGAPRARWRRAQPGVAAR
jgi:Fe-S cluster biogenesis protein NfuA